MKNFGQRPTILLLFSLLLVSLSLQAGTDSPLIGVKIYECNNDPAQLIRLWQNLGINCAFIGLPLAQDKSFIKLLKKNQITTFIIVPIFCSLDKAVDPPDLYAITGRGEQARVEWVHFICPTRNNHRQKKLRQIGQLIRTFQPDGISIDFIRYFIYWEKVYPNTQLDPLHNTCFCSTCLAKMESELQITFPDQLATTSQKAAWIMKNHMLKWVNWKNKVITSMVAAITRESRRAKPDILLNAHIIPWRQVDYKNGLKKVVAQDIKSISRYVDFLSPMCYHHMVKRSPDWVHLVVEDMARYTTKKILPSIQVKKAYLSEKLTPAAFRQALSAALKNPSSGVVFWNWKSLQDESSKSKILREFRPTNQIR